MPQPKFPQHAMKHLVYSTDCTNPFFTVFRKRDPSDFLRPLSKICGSSLRNVIFYHLMRHKHIKTFREGTSCSDNFIAISNSNLCRYPRVGSLPDPLTALVSRHDLGMLLGSYKKPQMSIYIRRVCGLA